MLKLRDIDPQNHLLGVRKAESVFGSKAWLEIATGVGMASVAYFRRRDFVVEFVRTNWHSGLVAGCPGRICNQAAIGV